MDTGAFFGTCGLGGPDDPPGYDPGMFAPCPPRFPRTTADDNTAGEDGNTNGEDGNTNVKDGKDGSDGDDDDDEGAYCAPVINCSSWPYESGRPLGTPRALAHLLQPFVEAYNHTAAVATGPKGADYP